MEYVARFLLGGTAVCLFAAIGDVARPKSFAGVFAAAPSVALATIALTTRSSGGPYAAIEARSMIIGAVAMAVYSYSCRKWFWRGKLSVTTISLLALAIWLAIALGGALLLRWMLA